MVSWGNEYVRNLAAEIAAEYHERQEKGESAQQLLDLVAQIVPYHMTHNAGACRQCAWLHCSATASSGIACACACSSGPAAKQGRHGAPQADMCLLLAQPSCLLQSEKH